MNGFEFQCGTKMIFGKDKELCVGEELKSTVHPESFSFTEVLP